MTTASASEACQNILEKSVGTEPEQMVAHSPRNMVWKAMRRKRMGQQPTYPSDVENCKSDLTNFSDLLLCDCGLGRREHLAHTLLILSPLQVSSRSWATIQPPPMAPFTNPRGKQGFQTRLKISQVTELKDLDLLGLSRGLRCCKTPFLRNARLQRPGARPA